MANTDAMDAKGLTTDEVQWINGSGNPTWEPTPERQAQLAAMGYTKGNNPRAAGTALPQDENGAVGYINTNKDDLAFGVPVYQDSYGNLFYTQPAAPGQGETRVMLGKQSSLPSYISQTKPSIEAAPLTGASAQDVANQEAPASATNTTQATLTPDASTQPVGGTQQLDTSQTSTPTSATPSTDPGTSSSTTTATTTTTTTQPGQITPEQIQQAMQQSGLTDLMSQAGLTPDQQKAVEAVYQATLANDQSYADRIAAAMQAASEYSSPYFKAQVALVSDNLSRALGSMEGDLAFKEQQLQSALQKLQQDTSASKEYLSFQHQQEMEDLARRYEINLENTRQDMAATGFTQSTRRSKAEGYLADVNQGAVESSNRAFSYQTGGLDRQLQYQSAETTAQIQNLQRLAAEGKLDLLRQSEQQLGSQGLQQLGYSGTDVLGGVGGSIPRQQALDQLSFAQNYIF